MNLSNKELKVQDLIRFSEEESIWLPEFQRPFVWDKNQVRLLIDSLYHDYTISSILLWTGGDELARRRVGANIKEIKIPQDKAESIVYLLDGQQRTTALTLAFTNKAIYRGNNIKKKEVVNIYYDADYKGDDPEMRWILEDEKLQHPNDEEQMLMLKELDDKDLFQLFGSRFIKLKHVYHFKNEFADAWFPGEEKEQKLEKAMFLLDYREKLENLKTNILERKVYDIEQKGTLEQVLEVFERINTKNTKLSIFDIMVAKTYRKYPEGFFDLRTYYKAINYKSAVKPNYFENLETIDLDKVTMKVDESFMLQLTMIMLNKKFKATEILKIRTDALMENTKYLHDKFHFLIGFMNQQFGISKEELNKYQPIMKFLAAALSHFDDVDMEKQNFLKKWFWNTLLKNRYPGAQNERIERDYNAIVKYDDLDKCLEVLVRENTRTFDIKGIAVDNIKLIDAHYSNRSQQVYRAMLLLLKSKKAQDFYNGLVAVKSGAAAHRLEEHHIFPKNSVLGKTITAKYKDHRYSDIINNVANISMLTKETNNKRIKNKLPSVYITDFENQYKNEGKYEEFLNIMESQFISPDMIEMLKKDQFEEFIIARTIQLLQQIESLCKVD